MLLVKRDLRQWHSMSSASEAWWWRRTMLVGPWRPCRPSAFPDQALATWMPLRMSGYGRGSSRSRPFSQRSDRLLRHQRFRLINLQQSSEWDGIFMPESAILDQNLSAEIFWSQPRPVTNIFVRLGFGVPLNFWSQSPGLSGFCNTPKSSYYKELQAPYKMMVRTDKNMTN